MGWLVKASDGTVFGPAKIATLKGWADESRITPEHLVSEDGEKWIPASHLAELGMIFLVELNPGNVFGPFTQKVIENMVDTGEFPADARVYVAQEMLASAMEAADSLKNDLAGVSSALASAKTELEAAKAEIAKLRQELDEKERCIVIDPEVLEPEEMPAARPVKEAPPRVSPLDNPASLEARLRNELIRARQKGMDFSFLKKR